MRAFFYLIGAFLAFFFALPLCKGEVSETASEEEDYVKAIEDEFGLVTDEALLARINSIASRLAAVVPSSERGEKEAKVKVLDDPSINAFALPNGYVYIFKGLVDECETDDMLASVIAHEFVHVFHGHHRRIGERQLRGMLIGALVHAASGEEGALLLGEILAASMVETYGRSAENDADRTAVVWLLDAGFDPLGYLELLQVLEQESIHQPQPGGNYFTVHPYPDKRMELVTQVLREHGVEVPESIYRVHLPLDFYLPLDDAEKALLDEWESRLVRSSSPAEAEIPSAMLNELRTRKRLFQEVSLPEGKVAGVITLGGTAIFYITAENEAELKGRAEDIIRRLGELLLNGLRNYEVQGRSLRGIPVLIARGKPIVYATDADAELMKLSPEEVNRRRVQTLKDILFRYFVSRRI